MKFLKLICLSCFFIFISCEKSDDRDESNSISLIKEWKLVEREYFFSGGGALVEVDVNEDCMLRILSDSSVTYNDPLLNFDWEGAVSFDEGKYIIDFGNDYFYSCSFTQDTLYARHFFVIPDGEPAQYIDVYTPID